MASQFGFVSNDDFIEKMDELIDALPHSGATGEVTGVKGNAESAYRVGNVNLTPANIGAATSTQGAKADSAVQTIQMNGSTVTKTGGTVNLGTVITAHQDISGKADKSATVSTVAYDATNKKLTKTINGTTSDVVTTAQLKTDMALSKSDVGLGNVGNFKAVSTVASQGLTDTEKANARANIGLGNVNNTSDANKPISTATQAALDDKLDTTGGAPSLFELYSDSYVILENDDCVIQINEDTNGNPMVQLMAGKDGKYTLTDFGAQEEVGGWVRILSPDNVIIGADGYIFQIVKSKETTIRAYNDDYSAHTDWTFKRDGPYVNGTKISNGVFRGKDLTNVYTIDQMYSMIHSGKFDDLFLGDYFTKSMTTDIYTRFTGASFASGTVYYEMGGTLTDRTWTETEDTAPQTGKIYATKTTKTENVTLMFAAFDYYYNVGDTALTTHHAVLIPRGYGFATTAKMNSSNTTVGSYFNSDMHQIVLPCYAKALKTVLNNHLLAHRTLLPNAINASTPSMAGAGFTGASNAWAWETVELQLMSEPQIYGTTVWSSSAYDVGADYKKLPVFDFINGAQYGRNFYWLRSVVSSTNFAGCDGYGIAGSSGASSARFVRPLILFG
jgi:hypothetical protein